MSISRSAISTGIRVFKKKLPATLTIGEMREQAQKDSVQLRKNLRLEPQPLTEGEKKLVQAIDNYIKLFPFEEGTAARLSQAGSIYYNRNDFRNALKYFKTLLKHFPDDPSAGNAEVLVMESYFGRLDYKSVEIVAKRIRAKTDKPEYAAKATKRLAESIFLQAESLAAGRLCTAFQGCRRVPPCGS